MRSKSWAKTRSVFYRESTKNSDEHKEYDPLHPTCMKQRKVDMRYRIRRIGPGSALRVGCAAGWLVMLCPALCLAGIAVQALQRINQAFAQIEPIDITVLGQPVARIDFLEILRLSAAAQTV